MYIFTVWPYLGQDRRRWRFYPLLNTQMVSLGTQYVCRSQSSLTRLRQLHRHDSWVDVWLPMLLQMLLIGLEIRIDDWYDRWWPPLGLATLHTHCITIKYFEASQSFLDGSLSWHMTANDDANGFGVGVIMNELIIELRLWTYYRRLVFWSYTLLNSCTTSSTNVTANERKVKSIAIVHDKHTEP